MVVAGQGQAWGLVGEVGAVPLVEDALGDRGGQGVVGLLGGLEECWREWDALWAGAHQMR